MSPSQCFNIIYIYYINVFISPNLGNLYFANIQMSDARSGKHYVCIANNHVIRGLVQGDDQVIKPFSHAGNDDGNHGLM